MCGHSVCTYVFAICIHRGWQKMHVRSLELKLQMVVLYHIDAGNWTWFFKEQPALRHLSSPIKKEKKRKSLKIKYMCGCMCGCDSQRTTLRCHFSPTFMWVSGIEPRSSGLCSTHFTCWDILLTLWKVLTLDKFNFWDMVWRSDVYQYVMIKSR